MTIEPFSTDDLDNLLDGEGAGAPVAEDGTVADAAVSSGSPSVASDTSLPLPATVFCPTENFISDSDDTEELLQPLPDGLLGTAAYELEELDLYAETLLEKGFVTASCRHEGILKQLPFQLADLRDLEHLQKFQYIPDLESDDEHFHSLLKSIIQRASDGLTIVHVSTDALRRALFNATTAPHFYMQCKLLRENHAYVVCLLYPPCDSHMVRENGFAHWNIDFLRPLLIHQFDSESADPRELCDLIEANRSLWPADPAEFCGEITKSLSSGYAKFATEVRRRLSKKNGTRAVPDLDRQGVVQQALYFVGAYFGGFPSGYSGLNPQYLDLLMSILLEGEHQQVPQPVTASTDADDRPAIDPDSSAPLTNAGGDVVTNTDLICMDRSPAAGNDSHASIDVGAIDSSPTVSIAGDPEAGCRSVPAVQYWREHRHQLLREVGMQLFYDGRQVRYYDFVDFGRREAVRRYFADNMSHRHDELFDNLYQSGILFARESDDCIVKPMVRFVAAQVAADPVKYDQQWLLSSIMGAEEWSSRVNIPSGLEPHDQIIALALALREKEEGTAYFYNRLAEILKVLLQSDQSKGTIDSLFHRLIHAGPEGATIVLRLAKRVRWTTGFEYFRWIRELLNKCPADARLSIQAGLVREASESLDRFEQVSTELLKWLPPGDAQVDHLEVAARYALAFLFDYFKFTRDLNARQLDGKGKMHAGFPADVVESPELLRRRQQKYLRWLCHKDLHRGVQFVTQDHLRCRTGHRGQELFEAAASEIDNSLVIALILESWLEEADGNETAASACLRLTEQIAERVPNAEKRALRAYFRQRTVEVREQLDGVAPGRETRMQREQLFAARRRVATLRERFAH